MENVKLLLYCTKEKNKYDRLVRDEHHGKPFYLYGAITKNFESLNGKIVAKCDFDAEKIRKGWGCLNGTRYFRMSENHYYPDFELEEHSCLSFDEMDNYLKGTLNEMSGHAIHIKNLHIFDMPKELSECHKEYGKYFVNYYMPIEKAPQNMMRVWLYENGEWVMYILISIRPQWMCKILNKEKDVEVRRAVLKEMSK